MIGELTLKAGRNTLEREIEVSSYLLLRDFHDVSQPRKTFIGCNPKAYVSSPLGLVV